MSGSEEENPIQTPRGFTFNEEQLGILNNHIPGVKSAERKKDRHKLVKAARKEVMALPASKALPAEKLKELTVAVNSWFAIRAKRSKQTIKFGKTWTGRLAMYHEKKEKVNELKAELFEEAKADGKDPTTAFNFFQKAMTEVWDGLSSQERKHYDTVAIEWNKEGVSKEQKQEYVFHFNTPPISHLTYPRAAMKHAVSYTKKFADDMYKSLGVRYLFVMAMETPSETMHTGILDFNDAIGGGKTYASQHANWQTEGIDLDYWIEHNRQYYDATKVPEDASTRKLPRGHLSLERNEYGEPVIPDPLFVPKQQGARSWRQNVVRAFLSKHYGTLTLSHSTYCSFIMSQNWLLDQARPSLGNGYYQESAIVWRKSFCLRSTWNAWPNRPL